MSEELKPCPFCGGEAELQTPELTGDLCGTVMCMDCYGSGPSKDDWRDALIAWNTRPIEDGLTEEIDRLRKTYANKAELVEALISVVDTARTAVEQQWCWRDQYPGQKVKYDRDIAPILTAEKLILKHKESK